MTEFPYAQSKKSLKGVIDKIPTVGVPQKVDEKFLKSIGFGSTNDRKVISVLRCLDFVDNTNQPTGRWRSFRNPEDSKTVMADALRHGYMDLFAQYPNADVLNSNELMNFFGAHTEAGADVIRKSVMTFTTLCEYADFDTNFDESAVESKSDSAATKAGARYNGSGVRPPKLPEEPALHIDIQIHISPSADEDQIDNIFKSMAKHLYNIDAN